MTATTIYPPPRLKLLPISERPAYRAYNNAAACNLRELLAVIVGGTYQIETASELLAQYGLTGLQIALPDELTGIPGIGPAKAVQIKAAIEFGRRLAVAVPELKPAITSPASAAHLVQHEMNNLEQEEMRVILLNTRNQVLKMETVYRGSLNSAQIRVGELFKIAVRINAAAIIAHNHPSHDPSPSPDDIAVTKAIVEAGRLLDIDVLDHLIIGGGQKWVSLKERGLGFEASSKTLHDGESSTRFTGGRIPRFIGEGVPRFTAYPKGMPSPASLGIGDSGQYIASSLGSSAAERLAEKAARQIQEKSMPEKIYLTDILHGKIVRFTFEGEDAAANIAATLVRRSAWFAVTPLPNDEWSVEVKAENEHVLERLITSFQPDAPDFATLWHPLPDGKLDTGYLVIGEWDKLTDAYPWEGTVEFLLDLENRVWTNVDHLANIPERDDE